jgi:hypothetical protein
VALLIASEAGGWWEGAFWIYTVIGFVPWINLYYLAFPPTPTFVLPPDQRTIGSPQTLRLLKESIPQRFMNVSPYEFEEVVCQMFEDAGFSAELTPKSGDFGADIILKKIGIDEKTAVQVKRYASDHKVGVKELSQAVAAREHYQCDKSMVITTSSFTSQAVQLAKSTQTVLWDWEKLHQAIKTLYLEGQEPQAEADQDEVRVCPKCRFPYEEGDKFCTECGEKLASDSQAPVGEEGIPSQTAPDEEVAMSALKDEWQVVKSWVGRGHKTTESFYINSDEWRITWETKGDPGEAGLLAYIYKKGKDSYTDNIDYDGVGSDTSYVHSGPGQYFLKIEGYGTGTRWKVTVEEQC